MTETKSSIDDFTAALLAAARENPVIEGPHGQRHILVPAGFTAQAAHDAYALPPHVTQSVTVDDRRSLIEYVTRYDDERTVLIADLDEGTISARIDWHDVGGAGRPRPQPNRHRCTLVLRPSEEFGRWNKVAGTMLAQAAFAEFLEENAVDVVEPDAADLVEIARDFEVTVGTAFKSSARLQNGDRSFSFQTETGVVSQVSVPSRFTVAIPLYQGEPVEQLTALFRWRATPEGLKLGFVWHRVEYLRRAHFVQIATAVAEATGCPVFYGRAI